jgi:chromobox protein 1
MSHTTRTYEPRRADSRREGAIDVMNEYFDDIGGRPQPTKGAQKRKGRASGVTKSEAGTPASSAKRVKQEQTWTPPQGSWENHVDYIDTVEERADPKTGELAKFAYLVWNNDKKTQHPLKHVYLKCPQKVCREQILCGHAANPSQMLLYYESHLVFTHNDGLNDDDDVMKDVY